MTEEFECFLCQEEVGDMPIKPLELASGDVVIIHKHCELIELIKQQVGKSMRMDLLRDDDDEVTEKII